MRKAYSQDLRDRVIDAVIQAGMSCRGAAKHYGVSASTAVKWLQAYHQDGRRGVKGGRGHPPSKVAPEREWIVQKLENQPDMTMAALADALFEAKSLRLHPTTLSRFLKREGISFKKNTVRRRTGQA